jgi:hypothetical protein
MEGKRNGCMDCSSCYSRIWFCSSQCIYRPPSFFGIEFARDAELQTIAKNTTQEAVVDFIQHRSNLTTGPWEHICVVNTGFHDMTIPGITLLGYVMNVKWYLSLLQTVCDRVLWVSLNYVLPFNARWPQNNSLISEWNSAVFELASREKRFVGWLLPLDIFNITSSWQHHDFVHLNPDFYFQPLLSNF